ncbi:MAG: flagellar basal body M-ring protein FliF [Gammaproteobacteria bacterium]|nr:flagellar basal body M-ring protein FliF [Gammaproteobacteria bacterium]
MAEIVAQDPKQVPNGLDVISIIRQIVLLLGLSGSVALGFWVVLWFQEPNYGVLFSTLDDTEASIILEALQQLGIIYKLDQSTGAVLVPSKDIHNARIKLAAQGLPKSTSGGFPGLGKDEGNSFGVSETMQRARFQKALELELARTISSIQNVKSARIHLAIPKQSVFIRDRQKPRASVVLGLYSGRSLTQAQVLAISHMVSASIPNLAVENVTVVDQKGRLLTTGERSSDIALTSSQFDYARKLEKSYIERIENILSPILGADSVRAQVTADIDFTRVEQTQESFNPDTPALRSNNTVEEQTGGAFDGVGVPGAVSNQPAIKAEVPEQAGQAEGRGDKNAPSRIRKKEIRNYELDKVVSHTRFATGRLRRLSTAIVVDDKVTLNADGQSIRVPRSPEEIERITNLAKKAIGFSVQRGDSVNVVNESFSVPPEPAAIPGLPIWEQPWVWDVVKQVVGVILIIVIFFGVLKPLWKSLMKTLPIMAAVQDPAVLTEPEEGGVRDDVVNLSGEEQKKLTAPTTPYEQNMLLAQQAVADDPKLVAQVVKNWVTDDG